MLWRKLCRIALLLCCLAPTIQAGSTPATVVLQDLGQPITQILSHDQALGFGPDGEPQAYFIVGGNSNITAEFAVVDIRTMQTVFSQRVPRGDTSWAIDWSTHEKAVYIGISSSAGGGELLRYRAEEGKLESLGYPVSGQRLWRLDVAPDGVVFGGTYPGGILFAYDPYTRRTQSYGQVVPGESYVQGIEALETHVWFGTQPNAKLGRLDRQSGKITMIPLPEPYAGWGGATTYDLYERNDLLFARVTGDGTSVMLVYHIPTDKWVDAIAAPGTRAVSPLDPNDGRTVYFRLGNGSMAAYDTETLTYKQLAWAPTGIPGDFAWIDLQNPDYPGLSLAFTYYYGRIYVYNPATGRSFMFQAELEGAANQLMTLTRGPDNMIYIGAYLSPPGMSRLDPATDKFELLAGAGQIEGYGVLGSKLLFGVYPNAGLRSYDTRGVWGSGSNPTAAVSTGYNQDRPKSFAALNDDLVVVASAPATGQHGGALTLWNPTTRDIQVFRNLIPQQAPISVAVYKDTVFAGTTIHGGFGSSPIAHEAVLFEWDPVTHEVLGRWVPVKGAAMVSALTWGPDGYLYGLATGTLFQFDPEKRAVVRTLPLSNRNFNFAYGDDLGLHFIDEHLYVTTRGILFHVDLETWTPTTLVDGKAIKGGVTSDISGDLYFIGDNTHVYRLVPPFPKVAIHYPRPNTGTLRGDLWVKMQVDGFAPDDLQQVELLVDGQVVFTSQHVPETKEWKIDTTALPDGEHELLLRATGKTAGTRQHAIRFSSANSWTLEERFLPAIDGGWFGTISQLRTSTESAGWQHVTDQGTEFFGDADRLVPTKGTEQFLIWSTPRLRTYEIVLYTQDPQALEHLELAVSADGTVWRAVTYGSEEVTTSPHGWRKMRLFGDAGDLGPIREFRLTVGAAASAAIQLGHADFAGGVWE